MREFRISFLVHLSIFAAFAFGLYLVKYEVQELQQELALKRDVLKKEKETIHLLNAEWAYLTKPERLQKLQKKYLKLQPITASQTLASGGIMRHASMVPASLVRPVSARRIRQAR
jgi:cell division protein FtsL